MIAKCRRPLGIVVSYNDENGIFKEDELYDFKARVFHHELDHNNGKPFIHWKVSEGEIEIKEQFKNESFENLKYVKNNIYFFIFVDFRLL